MSKRKKKRLTELRKLVMLHQRRQNEMEKRLIALEVPASPNLPTFYVQSSNGKRWALPQ